MRAPETTEIIIQLYPGDGPDTEETAHKVLLHEHPNVTAISFEREVPARWRVVVVENEPVRRWEDMLIGELYEIDEWMSVTRDHKTLREIAESFEAMAMATRQHDEELARVFDRNAGTLGQAIDDAVHRDSPHALYQEIAITIQRSDQVIKYLKARKESSTKPWDYDKHFTVTEGWVPEELPSTALPRSVLQNMVEAWKGTLTPVVVHFRDRGSTRTDVWIQPKIMRVSAIRVIDIRSTENEIIERVKSGGRIREAESLEKTWSFARTRLGGFVGDGTSTMVLARIDQIFVEGTEKVPAYMKIPDMPVMRTAGFRAAMGHAHTLSTTALDRVSRKAEDKWYGFVWEEFGIGPIPK